MPGQRNATRHTSAAAAALHFAAPNPLILFHRLVPRRSCPRLRRECARLKQNIHTSIPLQPRPRPRLHRTLHLPTCSRLLACFIRLTSSRPQLPAPAAFQPFQPAHQHHTCTCSLRPLPFPDSPCRKEGKPQILLHLLQALHLHPLRSTSNRSPI